MRRGASMTSAAVSSSSSVHQRTSPTPSARSSSDERPGRIANAGVRRRSTARSGRPTCSSGRCASAPGRRARGGRRAPAPTPRGAAGKRRGVVLALLHAAPRRRPDRSIGVVEADERDPLVGVEDERPDTGAEPHATSERSARNQASRSSHSTAAFAGEVDGRTKSSDSPSRRSWSPCLRPTAERPAVGLLADEADRRGVVARGPAARGAPRCRRSRAFRRSDEPAWCGSAAFVMPTP